MPPRKYTPDQIAEAYEMYAEGKKLKEIAIAKKIPVKTLQGWYARKVPGDWKEHRDRRVTVKAEIIEEEVLENYKKTAVRHQKLLKATMHRMVRRIVEANDQDLSVKDALAHYQSAIDQEREIFVPVEDVVKMRNKVAGMNFGVGASVEDKEGNRTQILGFLNQAFDKIHEPRNEREHEEPTERTHVEADGQDIGSSGS